MNLLVRNLYRKIFQNSYFDNRYQTALNVGMDHFQRCFVTNSTFLKKNINFRKSLIQLHTVKVAPGRNYSPNFNLDFGNVLKDTLKKVLLINSGALKRRGFLWYATIEGVRFNEFFELLELPDVFLSWFKITELHVWMLLVRLMQDGDSSRTIRSAVANAMWEDSTKRARTLAPMNKMYKENFKQLSKEFRTIIFAYDEAFLSDDKALCSVMWYYFFEKSCDDPKKLEALVSYIRYQINQLQMIDTKGIEEKYITGDIWTPLKPHFSN